MSSHEADTTARPSTRRMRSTDSSADRPPAIRITCPSATVTTAAPPKPMASRYSRYPSATASGTRNISPKTRTSSPQTWTMSA